MPRHSCEATLKRMLPSHAQAPNGESFTCTCGRQFIHVCDESEGCSWEPYNPRIPGPKPDQVFKSALEGLMYLKGELERERIVYELTRRPHARARLQRLTEQYDEHCLQFIRRWAPRS
jgi:hypothetical protein